MEALLSTTSRQDASLYWLLELCAQEQASDLHLTSDEPPILRIDGRLTRTKQPRLNAQRIEELIDDVLTPAQREQFALHLELDFAVALPGGDRFRANAHRQRGHAEAAFRRIPLAPPSLATLGLPSVVAELTRKPNGLVLVTGPTGMGKTTTLAAMVEQINDERECLIVTIEDPVEYLHVNRRSVIKQRQVHADTHSFTEALTHALRQDPDVIVVGEMRDLETISIALTAAETGHLVLATLHTPDAPQTIERIIDIFPAVQQPQVKVQLAECLQGVVSQLLLPHASGHGRVLATEIMVATPAVRNLIREQQIEQLPTQLQTGRHYGMQTMDKSLKDLVDHKLITLPVALEKAKHPDESSRL